MDCLEGLKKLHDNCIDCCITSPPYFGLRDYGTAKWVGGIEDCDHKKPVSDNFSTLGGGKATQDIAAIYISECKKCGAIREDNQIGLEETPELYVAKMVDVFTEVKRVLKKEGTLWLNLGDSYNGSGKGGNPEDSVWSGFVGNTDRAKAAQQKKTEIVGLKAKDLIGIPWLVAFALRSSGWYLRQDIIWHKPNPMPESVTDRCTKSHEYIFLLSKSAKYFYDANAISTEIIESTKKRYERAWNGDGERGYPDGPQNHIKKFMDPANEKREWANKKSVWTVTTYPYPEAHFATFPERLVVDMIKAGCPENGIVLDPFMGAGTTALVARKLNRNYIGFELNDEYIKIAKKRLKNSLGMFQ